MVQNARVGMTGHFFGRVEFQAERRHGPAMASGATSTPTYRVSRAAACARGTVQGAVQPRAADQHLRISTSRVRSAVVNDLVPLREVGVMAHGVVADRAVRYETGVLRRRAHAGPGGSRSRRCPAMALAAGGPASSSTVASCRLAPQPLGRGPHRGRGHAGSWATGSSIESMRMARARSPDWARRGKCPRSRWQRADSRRRHTAGTGDRRRRPVGPGGARRLRHRRLARDPREGPPPRRGAVPRARPHRPRGLAHFESANTTEPPFRNPRAEHVAPLDKHTVTLGVTWHLNRWMRVQSNVVRERLLDPLARYPVGQTPLWSAVIRSQVVM